MVEFLKEKSGKYSFTRISATLLILFYIVVGGYLSIKNGRLEDFPSSLGLLVGGLYGINKLKE
jgi:hypothetical protein